MANTLGLLTLFNELDYHAPQRGLGDAINRFIGESEARIRADPAPVRVWDGNYAHLPSYLGIAAEGGRGEARRMLEAGEPFWLVAGPRKRPPATVSEWLEHERLEASLSEAARSEPLAPSSHWPGNVVLYRVEPAR